MSATLWYMPKKTLSPEILFSALADETRLRILRLIGDREVCVCFFVQCLDEPQPKISRHLSYLRRTGLVETRREGKWMHYRIAPLNPSASAIVQNALDWIANTPKAKRDMSRFASACCKPERFDTLQSAPVPSPVSSCERC